MDTQEELLAFLLERILAEVLVIHGLLPMTVPVGWPFLYVLIRNRAEIHGVLENFLVLLSVPIKDYTERKIRATIVLDFEIFVRHTVWTFGRLLARFQHENGSTHREQQCSSGDAPQHSEMRQGRTLEP